MGFLGAFNMRVFGWLICLYVVSGLVCDVVDFGWLKLSLLIDVLGVLVFGRVLVFQGLFWDGFWSVSMCVFVRGECVDWCLFLGCV